MLDKEADEAGVALDRVDVQRCFAAGVALVHIEECRVLLALLHRQRQL
jgi:hypothetical protein